jgi:flotillin
MMEMLWIWVGVFIVAVLALMGTMAQLFRKVGPNEALIVYGVRDTRVVKGGGTVVFPMVENFRQLSLELMSFDVAPTQDLYTKQGVAVTVEAVAQIKVRSDQESILTAAEQFLTKVPEEREALIRLVMEGHLRGIIGQLTVEQLVKEPEMVGERVRATCAEDLNKMGLEVISFTIKEVRDQNEYITNMGRPDVARIKRDADIAQAEAERDTAIRKAQAEREAATGRALADQERVLAETLSEAKQAEARRELAIKQAAYQEDIQTQKAKADKAYELAANVMQQQVAIEAVKIDIAARQQQIELETAEIARREKELQATVLKPAEIERQRVETLAHAENMRVSVEADGQASAIRARGEAEAAIIFRKGEADANARRLQAEAYQGYTQAALIDKLMSLLPEIVTAMAAPLARVDKITVVSTGNGPATGLHKLSEDLTRMAAEVPTLLHTLTGVNLAQWLSQLRAVDGTLPPTGSTTNHRADAAVDEASPGMKEV